MHFEQYLARVCELENVHAGGFPRTKTSPVQHHDYPQSCLSVETDTLP